MRSARRFTILLMAAILAESAPASAQSIWLPRAERAVAIEGLKPFLDSGGVLDYGFFNSAWYISGRTRVSNSLTLVAEVPFAFASVDVDVAGFSDSESDAALGNIYLGLEIGKQASPLFVELGARAPLAPEDNLATVVGTFADLDRWEAFIPDLVPISGLVNYRDISEGGLLLRFRGGPILWIPTEGGDVELLGLLDAQVGYEAPNQTFGVTGGFTGRVGITTDGSFGDRTSFQAGANGWFGLGRVRPGAVVLIPLDEELQDVVNVTVGLNAQILLN